MEKYNEQWKDIRWYEGKYQVSSFGRLRQVQKDIILNHQRLKKGYPIAELYMGGKCKQFYIHRLVVDAFLPEDPTRPFVNHIDGNKTNNNLYNLERCTQQENIQHAFYMQLNNGSGHKVTREQFYEIKDAFNLFIENLADKYNCTPGTIKSYLIKDKYISISTGYIKATPAGAKPG